MEPQEHPLRFHHEHAHLNPTFGSDRFGQRAEAFARFFGTPLFLGVQTLGVVLWIIANAIGWVHYDPYPFILLNLAFSVQAAYAAPLILLAQTRQAERDKAHATADARHREALALEAARHSSQMMELLKLNTELTQATRQMTERIDHLTEELHRHILRSTATPDPS
ncbi:DUF1003 domain-containing protein [Leeia sp.]|uniref:DUF1003 domain-containing protein n=1 Tax=Leeia sp. TaxID=2884678 RepID=UPI0035B1E23E